MPPDSLSVMITIDYTKSPSFKGPNLAKLEQAEKILNQVLQTKMFQSKVLAFPFSETGGKTNKEIYDILLQPYTVKVRLFSTWKWWSRVVAWVTGKNATTIHYHSKFFYPNKPYEIAGTLLHELSHCKGFYHNVKPWFKSVPYAMNAIVEECAKELGLT